MRVAGVPVGVDAWLKTFVAKKTQSVTTDVAKLDVVSDGLLHNQLLHFCQNARMAFLGRNTPTPLLSEFMAQVDDTIVEAVCRHGTGLLRRCAGMEPHDCGGSSICEHQRMRSGCKDCGASSYCEHKRKRSTCRECGGSSICEYQRH